MAPIISVEKLERSYGEVKAVRGVSFAVEEGEIFGLLGPNGAGKSTTIKILVTLLRPHAGSVQIDGCDVTADRSGVRRSVGIIFQDPSLDERLTAHENLYFHARLYHVPAGEIKTRIDQALDVVDLTERRNDPVMKFSGGMKRRLEIARGILHTPKVLFLDEPTIGLDPQTRRHIWSYLADLHARRNLTVFLTTHYMEEAEICHRIAIMDHGEIIALDTPANLKKMVGGDRITLVAQDEDACLSYLAARGIAAVLEDGKIRFTVAEGAAFLAELFTHCQGSILEVDIKKPTLEDVFIKLTGRAIRPEEASKKDRLRSNVKMRKRR